MNGRESSTVGPVSTVFLDRDGVINRKLPEGRYVTRPDEFQLLPGVIESIARLNRAGVRVIVVSNQRGIALGLYTTADVEAIHAGLQAELKAAGARVDGFYFCPHHKNQCNCRKPGPGMFDAARADFPEIEPASSVMIGDSASDIEFGRSLGMRTIFIEGDLAHRKLGWEVSAGYADALAATIAEAVNLTL